MEKTIYRIVEINSELDYDEVVQVSKINGPGIAFCLGKYEEGYFYKEVKDFESKSEAYAELSEIHNDYSVTQTYCNGRKVVATEYFVTDIEMEKIDEDGDWEEVDCGGDYDCTKTQDTDWEDFYNEMHKNDAGGYRIVEVTSHPYRVGREAIKEDNGIFLPFVTYDVVVVGDYESKDAAYKKLAQMHNHYWVVKADAGLQVFAREYYAVEIERKHFKQKDEYKWWAKNEFSDLDAEVSDTQRQDWVDFCREFHKNYDAKPQK